MKLRPVYYSKQGGVLYQAGTRGFANHTLEDRISALSQPYHVNLILGFAPTPMSDVDLYFNYVHAPFGDNSQFKEHLPVIYKLARDGADIMRLGGTVMSHCEYGVNRSGLVNALIIRELEGCTGKEALATLRLLRRGACGGNKHFVKFLEELPCPSTTA